MLILAFLLLAAPAPAQTAKRDLRPVALKQTVDRIIDGPAFAPAFWGIEVRDLATGGLLYARNEGKNLMPASTMKLVTTAAALDILGPDARFRTTVETSASLSADGRLAGDLYFVGRGDPGLAEVGADGRDGLDALVDALWSTGLRVVDGGVVGRDAVFTGERRGPSWEWGDLVWCYGAEVAGLSWNGSCADLTVSPGARLGDPVSVTRRPTSAYYQVVSTATTSAAGQKSDLTLVRELGSGLIELSGTYPVGGDPDVLSVALENPVRYAAVMFAERLAARGIGIRDGVATASDPLPASTRVLATRESEPLAQILKETNKPSNNLRAESLLRLIGFQSKGEGSLANGLEARDEFLRAMGVDATGAALDDGSGMATTDLVTAHELVDLLAAMDRHRYAQAFRDSLPVAGVDGTLERRMRRTKAEGRIVAKTGTRHHVNALAGYATTVSGRRLAFSIVVNHHTVTGRVAAGAIDAICEALVAQ